MASPCLPAAAELMKEFLYFSAFSACFALQIRKGPDTTIVHFNIEGRALA
jgi:hypothetical protein